MASVVHISEKNVGLFLSLIPDYIKEEIMTDEDILLFGIESDDTAAGVCVVRLIAPEAHILWYYLHESFRGMGVGIAAFMELSYLLQGAYGVDYISMDIPAEGGQRLWRMINGFPVSLGRLPECHISTTVGRLRASKRLTASSKSSIPLSKLGKRQLKEFCGELKKRGMDLVPMPIAPKDYATEMSAIYMKDEQPTGILLVSRGRKSLAIPYLASLKPSPVVLSDMMCFVREQTLRVRDDVPISMNIVDKKLKQIVSVLLGVENDDEIFIHSKRAVIDLSYLNDADEEIRDRLSLWDEIKKS